VLNVNGKNLVEAFSNQPSVVGKSIRKTRRPLVEFVSATPPQDAQKGCLSHPPFPRRAKTRPFPSKAAGEKRAAGVPSWGTLRTVTSRERSQGRSASRRAWGRAGEIEAFSASCAHYQRISADAHVSPAPNAPIITRLPSLIRPSLTASSSAKGIDAADVLPYRSIFINTFSMGN